jgi:hypothetical protein
MRRLTLCLALFAPLAGCHERPDVVAQEKEAGLPFRTSPEVVEACGEGDYKGRFYTTDTPDGGVPWRMEGQMQFSLVKTGAEVLHIGPDAILSGSSTQPLPSQFHASVVANDCRAGRFETQLENGVFTLVDATTMEPSGNPVSFVGTVAGTYDAEALGFIGTWRAYVNDVLTMQGSWGANWVPY